MLLEKTKYYKLAKEVYARNENIVQKLMSLGVDKSVSIEIAYELQAGSYTSAFNASKLGPKRNKILHQIIKKYTDLSDVSDVGVFGVGEAANWIGFDGKIENFYGIELSYSRLRYARSNLKELSALQNYFLIKGDATELIFKPNSFDLTITLHSIEPNGNIQGKKMLNNVLNCSSKYILLVEPDFSSAPDEMKKRMEANDYTRNIEEVITSNPTISVIEKFNLKVQENEKNLSTCWIIKKNIFQETIDDKFCCPYSKSPLIDFNGSKYARDSGLIYPIIDDIFFINSQDAIFIGGNDLK